MCRPEPAVPKARITGKGRPAVLADASSGTPGRRSAERYIDVSSEGVDVPLGLGSRHMAAASITKATNAVAVVVSESSVVRVFDNGELIAEIILELWLLRQQGLHDIGAHVSQRSQDDVTVRAKTDTAAPAARRSVTATPACLSGLLVNGQISREHRDRSPSRRLACGSLVPRIRATRGRLRALVLG